MPNRQPFRLECTRGERNRQSKLTDERVRYYRKAFRRWSALLPAKRHPALRERLAARAGISVKHFNDVVANPPRAWRHVVD